MTLPKGFAGLTSMSTRPLTPTWESTLPSAMLPPWAVRFACTATSLPYSVMLPPEATRRSALTSIFSRAAMRTAPSASR